MPGGGSPEPKHEYRYNSRGLRIAEDPGKPYAISYTLGYGYNDAGDRIEMTYPGGTALCLKYDNLGRLVRIPGYFGSEGQPEQNGFVYDANGFLISATAANGVASAYTADAQGRLSSIAVAKQQPAQNILGLNYSYTPQGNVSCISGANGGSPFELRYGYDWVNRLTSAHVPKPSGKSTVEYQYDGAGNRTSETWFGSGTVQYQYSAGNYLSSRGAANYAWGPYGQLISKTEGAVTTEYGYNAQRLMNAVKVGGAVAANYEYDALGRRVKAVEGDATVITLHSEHDIVYEVREVRGLSIPPGEMEIPLPEPGEPLPPRPPRPPRTPAPEYDVTVTCYLALNGKYLAKIVRENSNPAQTYFLHADMVGSIRAITDSAGQVVARFDYEPFDLLAVSTGPMASGAHRFTGKPEDGATKLYYFGARYYDPEVGRFISRDPARQGPNWYIYCGNPRSACRCYHFGIWALPWASQPDDKTALRGDRPDKTMRSRGLSSLPENRTVFSSTCRNSVRFCAVGRNRRPFRGL